MATRNNAGARARDVGRFASVALSRGAALFFGAYALADAVAGVRVTHPSQDLW